MVTLLLRQCADSVHKVQRLLEVGKGESAGDVMLVHNLPMRPFGELLIEFFQFTALQRRNSSAAGNARFGFKRHIERRSSAALNVLERYIFVADRG